MVVLSPFLWNNFVARDGVEMGSEFAVCLALGVKTDEKPVRKDLRKQLLMVRAGLMDQPVVGNGPHLNLTAGAGFVSFWSRIDLC